MGILVNFEGQSKSRFLERRVLGKIVNIAEFN